MGNTPLPPKKSICLLLSYYPIDFEPNTAHEERVFITFSEGSDRTGGLLWRTLARLQD